METPLMSLWLPIVLSGVALFFASFAAWMLLPHHKGEWTGLANEESVLNAIKSAGVPAGQYVFPYCTPEDWKSPGFKEKLASNPNGNIVIWSGPCSMGKNMLFTVIYFLVVSFTIAYLAAMVIPPTNDRWFVFRFAGTAGILVYAGANILNAIWFGRKMVRDICDGIAYGLITGAIFAWLWPAAVVMAA